MKAKNEIYPLQGYLRYLINPFEHPLFYIKRDGMI